MWLERATLDFEIEKILAAASIVEAALTYVDSSDEEIEKKKISLQEREEESNKRILAMYDRDQR